MSYSSNLFISTVYLAGLVSILSPCTLPVLPLYIAVLSEGKYIINKIINTILFIIGLGFTFVLLGYGFGFIGHFLYNDTIRNISALIIILIGIIQLDIFTIGPLKRTKVNLHFEENTYVTSILLGLSFSLSWTPCVTPVLSSILLLASNTTSTAYSILLLMFYTLGLATPFLIFTFLSERLIKRANYLNKYSMYFKRFGGILVIIMGVLLLLRYF